MLRGNQILRGLGLSAYAVPFNSLILSELACPHRGDGSASSHECGMTTFLLV